MKYEDRSADNTLLELDGEPSPLSIRAKALVFADPSSQALLQHLQRVAPSEAPILINGETGTGKELVARHVHRLSGRSGPFVAVNCGAVNEQLAESEWFGHEAGAFTGAAKRREGWFEAADGGTLFLDEIGDLPSSMQVKLLRVLQEREVVRVGSRSPKKVDIRLLAATNINLEEAVSAGRFRLDLFYRINIAPCHLPPLRERRGDIAPLAEHFLERYRSRLGLPPQTLSPAARQALERYRWPGNIRELENVIHYALLIAPDGEIGAEHLKLNGSVLVPAGHHGAEGVDPPGEPFEQIESALEQLFADAPDDLLNQIERRIVDLAFTQTRYNQVRAARLLGISRNVLRTLLKKHGHLATDSYAS